MDKLDTKKKFSKFIKDNKHNLIDIIPENKDFVEDFLNIGINSGC